MKSVYYRKRGEDGEHMREKDLTHVVAAMGGYSWSLIVDGEMGPPATLFLLRWTRRKQRPPASLQTTGSEGPLRPSDLLPWKGGKRELGMGWGSGAMGGRGRRTLATGMAGGGRRDGPCNGRWRRRESQP